MSKHGPCFRQVIAERFFCIVLYCKDAIKRLAILYCIAILRNYKLGFKGVLFICKARFHLFLVVISPSLGLKDSVYRE